MTNFEKWKQELSVEMIVQSDVFSDCRYCPATDYCDGKSSHATCPETFRGWAEQENE